MEEKKTEEKGLRYNTGKPKWSLVDFTSLEPLAKVMEYGAHKYSIFEDDHGNQFKGSEISKERAAGLKLISSGKDNWKKGLDRDEVLESLSRHLFALMDGEEIDPDSGEHHIGHIMCNTMFWSYHNIKISNEKETSTK